MAKTRLLVIGDLHGKKPILHYKGFDAIIGVGDFCSDKVREYIDGWENAKRSDGKPYHDPNEYIIAKYGSKFLHSLEQDSLIVGRKIMECLNSIGKPVFIVPGNWDSSFGKVEFPKNVKSIVSEMTRRHKLFYSKRTNSYLTKGLKNIKDCQFKTIMFNEYAFVGYGLNMVPELGSRIAAKRFNKRISRKSIKKIIKSYNNLYKKLENACKKNSKVLIFISHNMPYRTAFDKIRNPGSKLHNRHYGSNIARDFILKNNPLLCIGGHMHEHFGKTVLGKTTVINAGFGPKVNTLIELDGNKIKRIRFYPNPRKR